MKLNLALKITTIFCLSLAFFSESANADTPNTLSICFGKATENGTVKTRISMMLFDEAVASQFHLRQITGAVCTSGTFLTSKSFGPGAPLGQVDFDGIVHALDATVVEKGKSGAFLFLAPPTLCPGATVTPIWATVSYNILY